MIEQKYEVDTSVSDRTFYTIEIQTESAVCDIMLEKMEEELWETLE